MPEPSITENLEETKQLAFRVIDFLLGHGIAPAPLSYAVIYEYLGGTNGELRQRLDEHLQTGKALDEFLLRDLHDIYLITDAYQQQYAMGGDLRELLNNLLEHLSEAGEGTKAYHQSLQKNIAHLQKPVEPASLRAIAVDILETTEAAQARTSLLQARLETSQQETERLRAELEQQRREAQIDPLTGLFNRRALDAHLNRLMTTEEGEKLSMVLLDIDYFKQVNDTYGHALGDAVIRSVANTIRKCIRGDDYPVRFGGEEFLVLLPNTSLDGAAKVAETIRVRIEALRLVRRRDNLALKPFTVSLGVAQRQPDDTRESLFERADRALYQSKQGGRNRVTVGSA